MRFTTEPFFQWHFDDARRLVDGPSARAWFDHQLPMTFHGTFAPRR